MKAAANVSSTRPSDTAEAIRINRTLWGNLAAATVSETKSKLVESKKRKRQTKRSATEIIDRCFETVRATSEDAVAGLRRMQAPQTRFEQLFAGLAEILADVRRRSLGVDNEARPYARRRDQA